MQVYNHNRTIDSENLAPPHYRLLWWWWCCCCYKLRKKQTLSERAKYDWWQNFFVVERVAHLYIFTNRDLLSAIFCCCWHEVYIKNNSRNSTPFPRIIRKFPIRLIIIIIIIMMISFNWNPNHIKESNRTTTKRERTLRICLVVCWNLQVFFREKNQSFFLKETKCPHVNQ